MPPQALKNIRSSENANSVQKSKGFQTTWYWQFHKAIHYSAFSIHVVRCWYRWCTCALPMQIVVFSALSEWLPFLLSLFRVWCCNAGRRILIILLNGGSSCNLPILVRRYCDKTPHKCMQNTQHPSKVNLMAFGSHTQTQGELPFYTVPPSHCAKPNQALFQELCEERHRITPLSL